MRDPLLLLLANVGQRIIVIIPLLLPFSRILLVQVINDILEEELLVDSIALLVIEDVHEIEPVVLLFMKQLGLLTVVVFMLYIKRFIVGAAVALVPLPPILPEAVVVHVAEYVLVTQGIELFIHIHLVIDEVLLFLLVQLEFLNRVIDLFFAGPLAALRSLR